VKTIFDSLVGPAQWGLLQVVYYESNSTEYIYENSDDGCDADCTPSDLKFELTDHEFPFPGEADLGVSFPVKWTTLK